MAKRRKVFEGSRGRSSTPGKLFVDRPRAQSSIGRLRERLLKVGLAVSGEPEVHNNQFPRRGPGVPWTTNPH